MGVLTLGGVMFLFDSIGCHFFKVTCKASFGNLRFAKKKTHTAVDQKDIFVPVKHSFRTRKARLYK